MYRFSLFLILNLAGISVFAGSGSIAPVDSVRIITDTDSLLVCEGTSIQLAATAADSFSWTPAGDFDNPMAQQVTLTPSQSQWYFLTAYAGGVECVDSIYVTLVDPEFQVEVSTTDTICPFDPVTVTFISNAPITSVMWRFDTDVEDPENTTSTVVRPAETTEYIVTATIGNCEVMDTFVIRTVPFKLDLLTEDTMYLCKPESGVIRFLVVPSSLDVVWSPLDGNIDPQNSQATVDPPVSTTYNATAMFMGCTLSRDIFVRVDSLPPLDLALIAEKDPYCAGDEIYIIGANVDTANYPDLLFQWAPDDGQIQDSTTTGNVYVILNDTTRFVRYVINNACEDSSEVTVNVIPPEIPLSVNDTTLCPGETFVVEILDSEVEDIEWMPEVGLSCTDCPNPTVTVQATPVEYTVSGEKQGCPVGASLSVRPKPDYEIPVTPNPITGCPGDEIQIMIDTSGGVTNLSLSLDGANGTLSCTNCPNPVLTLGSTGGSLIISGDQTNPAFCNAFNSIAILIGEREPQAGPAFILCQGESTVIDLTPYGFINPQLSTQGDVSASCNNCLMPTVTLNGNSGSLVVTSDEENPPFCGSVTTFPINAAPMDLASFELSDSMPGQGEIITVTLNTTPPPSPGSTFTWSVNGNPVSANSQIAEISLNDAGNNTIAVTWINSSGCLQSASIDVFAREPVINIPNAFTPNNDEFNDKFRIEIVGNIELTEFVIFNRWGQVVFDQADPDGWDGTHNGEPAPPEVYVYVAKFRFPNGNIDTRKGDLTLIR